MLALKRTHGIIDLVGDGTVAGVRQHISASAGQSAFDLQTKLEKPHDGCTQTLHDGSFGQNRAAGSNSFVLSAYAASFERPDGRFTVRRKG